MPAVAEYVIVALFVESALAALSVTVPQALLWTRLWRQQSPVAVYTFKTVAWTGSLGVILLWRGLVFLDTLLFNQQYLGRIDDRWAFEMFLALLLVVAINYGAGLYHWTVTFGHGKRGTTGVPRRAARKEG